MDSRLMVTMEVDKSGNKFVFSLPHGSAYQLAFEALAEFQAQLTEWQRIQEQQAADASASKLSTQQHSA